MEETKEAVTIREAVERFLEDIGRAHSPATRKTYRVALYAFLHFIELEAGVKAAETSISQLSPELPVIFLRFKADGGKLGNQAFPKASRATLSTTGAGLSRFVKWCIIERLLPLPGSEFERMQLRLKEINGKLSRNIISKVPPDEVISALLAEVKKPRPGIPRTERDKRNGELIRLRDIALIEALHCSGARVSELTGLSRSDLDYTNHRATAKGKGDKERWLYFNSSAWAALEEYLAARNRVVTSEEKGSSRRGRDYSGQPLFARHDRGSSVERPKALSSRSVRQLVLALVERAELDSNITPHKFRHWVATRLLAETGDLAATQDLLGHASPTTTRIYAQVSEKAKQTLHRQVFK